MYRLDNWISERSGGVVEYVNSQYLNISTYAPLVGSSFIELPKELNNSKKGLINLRNKDNKCFLWCHVRHLNLVRDHSTRIRVEDKRIADTLDYSGVGFPVSAKNYGKIEDQNSICVNVFSYEGKIVCPIYISKKEFDNCMNVLMIHEEANEMNGANKVSAHKSHYVYLKDFNRLMFNITKHKEMALHALFATF